MSLVTGLPLGTRVRIRHEQTRAASISLRLFQPSTEAELGPPDQPGAELGVHSLQSYTSRLKHALPIINRFYGVCELGNRFI